MLTFSCHHDPTEPIEPKLPLALKPNDFPPGQRKHGWASAIKNDTIDWQASARASFHFLRNDFFFCAFTTHATNEPGWDFYREQLTFGNLTLRPKTYPLKNNVNWNVDDGIAYAVGSRYLGEGDEVVMRYEIDESYSDENYIKISVIDTVAKVAEGEFSAHFVADTFFNANLWLYPKHTSFKSGKFRCQLVPW